MLQRDWGVIFTPLHMQDLNICFLCMSFKRSLWSNLWSMNQWRARRKSERIMSRWIKQMDGQIAEEWADQRRGALFKLCRIHIIERLINFMVCIHCTFSLCGWILFNSRICKKWFLASGWQWYLWNQVKAKDCKSVNNSMQIWKQINPGVIVEDKAYVQVGEGWGPSQKLAVGMR